MATDIDALFEEEGDDPRPILSDEDIAEAKAKAKAKVEAALKKAALDEVIAKEEFRLQRLAGARTGKADMDEIVDVSIDLPEFCPDIRINGVIYQVGQSYPVPRHVANGLREIMQRTYQHQMTLDGKDMAEQYRRNNPVKLSANSV